MFKLHHDMAIVITFGILQQLGVWARLNRNFWGQKLVNLVFSRMQPLFCPLNRPINILETQITDKIANTSHSQYI